MENKTTHKWAWPGSRDQFRNIGNPLITFERKEQSALNLLLQTIGTFYRYHKPKVSAYANHSATEPENYEQAAVSPNVTVLSAVDATSERPHPCVSWPARVRTWRTRFRTAFRRGDRRGRDISSRTELRACPAVAGSLLRSRPKTSAEKPGKTQAVSILPHKSSFETSCRREAAVICHCRCDLDL